jgi:hypothetical protein
MIAALRVIQIAALGIGVGSIVFLSFVVAPSLFGALPREMAGRATAAIFPRYHLVVGACAATAIAAALLQAIARGGFGRRFVVELVLLAAMALPVAWGGLVVLPRASAARATLQDPARAAEQAAAKEVFGRLHRRSVALNATALLAGLAALAVAAAPLREP